MLNEKQSKWIVNQMRELLSQTLCYPFLEEAWGKMFAEADQIYQTSKQNPDCLKVIETTLCFLESFCQQEELAPIPGEERP